MIEGANGVQIEVTPEMIEAVCERFGVKNVESNRAGIEGTLAGLAKGIGTPDAYLFDSPEKRDLFAPIRKSYFAARGMETEPEYSKVSWEDRPSMPTDEKGEDSEDSEE